MQRILIVDDSASIRERFTEILSPLGVCDSATNGREAVDLIKSSLCKGNRYDLVLMDIIMPEKDGLTAVKEIREFEKSCKSLATDPLSIIIVTTLKDPSRILIAQYECGADAYISKPFTKKTVLQTLRNNGLDIFFPGHDDIDHDIRWGSPR